MVDHQPINFFICGNEAIRDQLEHGGYFDAFPVIAYAFSNLELGSFAIRSVSDFRYTWIYEYERSDRPYLLVYVEETFYKIREDYYLDPDIEPVYNKQIWKLEEFDASELIGLLRESNEDVDFIISGLKEYSFILWEGMGDLSAWLFDSSLYDPEEDYFGQRKVSVDHPQDDEIRIHYEFDRRVVSLEYWTRVIWFEPGLVEEPKPNAWDLERINETELLYEKELNRIRTFFIKNRKESTIAIDDQDLLDLFPGTYKGAVHPENVALGYGKYSDEHGNFYEGGFVAGVRHGIGKLSYTRTDIIGETRVTYIGWWNNGKYSGAGILWEG
ncbi:MAG TPA: hypothetical protein PLV56_10480, partial [Synergistales bacterium]|nr:hypothetical protein [Synergistales bacterium]